MQNYYHKEAYKRMLFFERKQVTPMVNAKKPLMAFAFLLVRF